MRTIQEVIAPEHPHWTKEVVEKVIKEHSVEYTIDNDCIFYKRMLVAYDFSKNPLFDKYRTVFITIDRGIVLSTRNSMQINNRFSDTKLIGKLDFQRYLARLHKLRRHHMIALGPVAFLSLTGHRRKSTDWINLRYVNKYEIRGSKIFFQTISIENENIIFEFPCTKYLAKNFEIYLKSNSHVLQMIISYLSELDCKVKIHNRKTILCRNHKSKKSNLQDLPDIQAVTADVMKDRINYVSERVLEEHDIVKIQDHGLAYRILKRLTNHH